MMEESDSDAGSGSGASSGDGDAMMLQDQEFRQRRMRTISPPLARCLPVVALHLRATMTAPCAVVGSGAPCSSWAFAWVVAGRRVWPLTRLWDAARAVLAWCPSASTHLAYKDGVEEGKAETVQQGFDAAFCAEAVRTFPVGQLQGVLRCGGRRVPPAVPCSGVSWQACVRPLQVCSSVC